MQRKKGLSKDQLRARLISQPTTTVIKYHYFLAFDGRCLQDTFGGKKIRKKRKFTTSLRRPTPLLLEEGNHMEEDGLRLFFLASYVVYYSFEFVYSRLQVHFIFRLKMGTFSKRPSYLKEFKKSTSLKSIFRDRPLTRHVGSETVRPASVAPCAASDHFSVCSRLATRVNHFFTLYSLGWGCQPRSSDFFCLKFWLIRVANPGPVKF